ncbi:hypothetical protein Btru_020842 [Bulinus truncatus]|nr:hypothetical protein Btru_020842 [Bulinus truncatus]
MEEKTYSSLSRHGLASSYSYLDGVPFKISANFRQPPQVISLSEIMKSSVHAASSFDYDFKTEEGVLNWVQARAEAAKKQQAIKQELKEEKEDNAIQSSQTAGDQNLRFANEFDTSLTHKVKQKGELEKPSLLPKPVVSAKYLSETGTILKPIPIHPSAVKKLDTADTQSKFDVSIFESESDPLDTVMLKTINDLEELKVVLDTSSRNSNLDGNKSLLQSDVAQPECSSPLKILGEINDNLYDVAVVIPDENSLESTPVITSTESENISVSFSSATNISKDGLFSPLITEDDEYVEIVDHAVNSQNNFVNGIHNSTGWALSSNMFDNKLRKSVLPPISNTTDLEVDSSEIMKHSANPFTQLATNDLVLSNSTTNNVLGSSSDSIESRRLTNTKLPPPVASKPLKNQPLGARMWSSVGPSSFSSLDDNISQSESILTNPYSRYHLSSSDFELSKSTSDTNHKSQILNPLPSVQPNITPSPWNKHRPLPPPPSISSSLNKKVDNAEPLGLTDPYYTLSKEDRLFVDSLTSMGFHKARVARAVSRFGQDEKEVLDHLLAVDRLLEQKFAPVFVESALQTYKNDVVKVNKETF